MAIEWLQESECAPGSRHDRSYDSTTEDRRSVKTVQMQLTMSSPKKPLKQVQTDFGQ